MSEQATSMVFIDNERTRVTEWRFTPGAATGWHRHEYDYVVVPTMDGTLKIVSGDGEEALVELKAGVPYFRPVGVEHDVINAGTKDYAFMEVELK